VVQHLGAAFARIWTLNEEENVLELQASAGMYTHLDGPHGRVPVGRFKIGLIAHERRPHLTNEVLNDPRIDDREWAKREGLVSFAGHPLVVEDRLVGVMAMFAREPLREDAVESLASVAGAIAQGIQRNQAEEALKESEERHRRQARELALLHEVRTALAMELDLPSLLREVVEAIARTYGYTLVSAYLLRDGGLVLQHQVGYRQVIERIVLTEGVSGEVARTGRAALLEDVTDEPKFLGAIEGIVSEICVPLFDGDRVVGTLNVESTNDANLTEADLRLMEAVCEHVSIALGRAGLYDRVRESEEKFRALIQNSSDLITLYDADGTIRYVSPALKRILDYEPEERIGATSFGLIHPDDVSRAREGFAEALRRPGVPISVEVRAQRRDGSWRYIEAVGTNLLDHPSVGAVVLNGRDITERKEAEARLREAEERYRTLVERMPAITYIQEPSEPSRTTYISPQCEGVLGYSQEECMNEPELWIRTLHPDDRERVLEQDRRTNATGEPFEMEYRQFAKDGSVVWIRDEAAPVRDEEGRPKYWIGVQVDITERKMLEERLEHRAFHDPLTGLPNRALFMDRLRSALSRSERKHGQTAVLFLDIDNLKVVNDSLGHEAGDGLLTGAAERLKACLRPADTVARFSGDEFAILLDDVEDVSETAQVAERIAEVLRAPLVIKKRETFITASVGIALSGPAPTSTRGSAPDTAQDRAETLLRQADLAMYRAKNRGKAHHEVFDPGMNAPAFVRLETANDLRRALEREEFRVWYQPKMRLHADAQRSLRLSNGSAIVAPKAAGGPGLVGMEALVRWEHPERGLLTPKGFVPVAEESGLIVPIGRMVLEKACRQAQAWQERYATEEPLVMCVNISARQFQHPELAQDVARVLQQTGLEPRCLQLEITESVVMEDVESTLDTLRSLQDLGVQLAIDDFGTGYSSFSYLRRFPVSVLKIDRSFVEPLGGDPEDAVIVSGVVSLAHTLGMEVVAEGVETAEQLAHLQDMGCDMAQGNYFAEPLPSEAVGELLARSGLARPHVDS
jgi:diguanylate cyclase (GGDEF)-like protein/PAS domain S-box-containing protein